jgi:uncharacterized delta-60 repeat protein
MTAKRHSRRSRKAVIAAAFVALLAVPAWVALQALAAPGDPVGGFGGDGLALLGPDTKLTGAALQSDGKLVAVGSQGEDAEAAHLLVARFTAAGAPDRSFSGDGVATLPINSVGDDVAVQPDGKIVAVGSETDASGRFLTGMLAARFTANGAIDGSFSGDGVFTAFDGQPAEARAVTFVGTKVLLAGAGPIGGFPRLALVRLNPDGSPDGSFGSGGFALHDFGRLSVANDVALDGSKIVVAGSQRENLQTTNVLAARFNSNGSTDPSFVGNSGIPGLFVKQYARGAGYSAAHGVALQGSKVILAGNALNGVDPNNGADALVIRLNSNGTPDGSFSGGGAVYLPATTHHDQYTHDVPLPGAHAVVLQGGAIVLGGYFDNMSVRSPALWALTQNGSPLGSFGQGGRTITNTGDSAELLDLIAASDGSLFGVGDSVHAIDAPHGLAAEYSGLGGGAVAGRCLGKPATVVGTNGRDVLRGTTKRDVIAGLGGNDKITALAGNDIACGGGGNDKIYLGGGKDKASGGGGADLLVGGAGNDRLLGNAGKDRLLGGAGADFLRGGGGKDGVVGGPGNNNVKP